MKTRTQKIRGKIKYCIKELCFTISQVWRYVMYPVVANLIGHFGSYALLQNNSIKNFAFGLMNTTDIGYVARLSGRIASGIVLLFYIVIWVIIEISFFLDKKKERSKK